MTSRRDALAGLGGAVLVSIPSTRAEGRPVQAQESGTILDAFQPNGRLSPRAFGAPLDGSQSDSSAYRSAIDAVAERQPLGGSIGIDHGAVLLTDPIDLAHYVTLDFGRAEVRLRPTGSYSIGVGLDQPAFSTTLSGRLLQLFGRGKTAISVRNGAGFQMLGCDVDLRSEDQIGLLVSANDDPQGPYYGLVDNVRINGGGLAGQTGVLLKQKAAPGSIGVNRWIFNNLRHIASLELGLDLQGTDGLTISNVNLESCHGSAIRFGHGARTLRGRVTAASGAGAFRSNVLAGMALDPVGAIEMLSGRNRGETMIAVAISDAGEVLFPAAFPYTFAVGDEFVFTESKCRSVSVTNATYEGGSNDRETAFDFAAGARSCHVQLGFLTMVTGFYFRRAIEDISNTIASRQDIVRVSVDLGQADGEVWLPSAGAARGQGGYLTHEPSWIDGLFVTSESGNAGFVDVEVVVRGVDRGLATTLTPDSPYAARRVRRELRANEMLGSGMSYAIRVRNRGMRGPDRINIEVVVGVL